MKNWIAIVALTFTLSSCDALLQVLEEGGEVGGLKGITEQEAVNGLKQALEKGTDYGAALLSAQDGFLKNNLYKILVPEEAKKAEEFLRKNSLGFVADNAIEAMNRGAEEACKEAKPIFVNAIKAMTIQDGINIVTGGDGAATAYLVKTTSAQLTEKFEPVIQRSLDKVGGTKNWAEFVNTYNNFYPILVKQKINPDLNAYVTEKALSALFSTIRQEEDKIRANPIERTTDILRKVFGYADSQISG